MLRHTSSLVLLALVPFWVLGQQPASKSAKAADPLTEGVGGVDISSIPEKTLNFSPGPTPAKLPISPITSFSLCDSGGHLILDMINPKDLSQHRLVSIYGGKSQTYLPSAISDIHDQTFRGFYSSGDLVAFLVQGTRQSAGSAAGNKSPAGYEWTSYHEYIAKFKPDGTYQGSVELEVPYDVSHVALFPSGDILAVGYDRLNSTLRLLVLDSSGKISRTIDEPTGRRSIDAGGNFGSARAILASESVIGSITFTPYRDNVLVWRRNSNDPILEVLPGGATHEVTLQVPKEFTFVEMIPASDWWVANLRRKDAKEDAPYGPATYTYFEVSPQDGSLSTRLSISKGSPVFLACEAEGNYSTFEADKDNNILIYNSK